ncbi:MAG: c-type cytochrome [Kiloniellales bacterium]|nr:c-type cytochrome [Kiloniellales bacterium]
MKRLNKGSICLTAAIALAAGMLSGGTGTPAAASDGITFLHALDDQPIEFAFRADQTITPAVEAFHRTAENPYRGDAEAKARGKKLYLKWCKACHLKDGSGRIGPNLTDDKWKYKRAGTDKGNFEIIYAGGAGAMQAFGRRMDQDDILKLMAYLEVLGRE